MPNQFSDESPLYLVSGSVSSRLLVLGALSEMDMIANIQQSLL